MTTPTPSTRLPIAPTFSFVLMSGMAKGGGGGVGAPTGALIDFYCSGYFLACFHDWEKSTKDPTEVLDSSISISISLKNGQVKNVLSAAEALIIFFV